MRGFTLLELMTTLAIFSLVATLSVASLGPMRDRYAHDQAVQLVVGTGVRARHLARDGSRCHVVWANNSANSDPASYLTVGTDGDRVNVYRRKTADCDSGQPDGTNTDLIESVRMPKGMKVKVSVGKPEWRPNGRLQTNVTSELVVTGANRSTVIRYLAHGGVCVVKPNGVCS